MAAATPVRRKLRYVSFDEVLADAERLVRARAATTGNWSLDQILGHLAIAIEKSLDATPGELEWKPPWYLRLAGRYLIKRRILKRGMPSGFKLPAEVENRVVPAAGGDVNVALDRLRRAAARLQSDSPRCPHPLFGPMPPDEWNRWHLRHAEMHLSFVKEPGS
jgi:hypothetical protein